MRLLTTIDTILSNAMQNSRLHCTSQISYEDEVPHLFTQFVCAVPMCLYTIVTEYNWSLVLAHAFIDDDRYDLAKCDVSSKLTMFVSDYLELVALIIFHMMMTQPIAWMMIGMQLNLFKSLDLVNYTAYSSPIRDSESEAFDFVEGVEYYNMNF